MRPMRSIARVSMACVWMLLPQAPPDRDLTYGADPKQRLDLAVPAAKNFATLIFVHGGSLNSGDKADADYGKVCDPFPAAGIACANMNYRLMPDHRWPAQPEDVAAAVMAVRATITARGGNPDRMFLMGHSSGAMLVALVGSNPVYLQKHGARTTILRGVIPMGSIMWDDDLQQQIDRDGRDATAERIMRDSRGKTFGSLDAYQAQWPIHHVRAGLPPFLFLIAESEQINPPILKTNRKFVDDARALGNEAEFQVLPGRTHYSAIRQLHVAGDPVFAMIRDWVLKH